jgi:hypothetical protein
VGRNKREEALFLFPIICGSCQLVKPITREETRVARFVNSFPSSILSGSRGGGWIMDGDKSRRMDIWLSELAYIYINIKKKKKKKKKERKKAIILN